MKQEVKLGKLLVFSAPSGSGKTTLVRYIMNKLDKLSFSVSATSRKIRGNEVDGKDYYFLTADEFRSRIEVDGFVEWEEVYTDRYYGTLKEEVDRIRKTGNHVVFDVDVVGGVNIKKLYGNEALAIFVMPPSIEVLKERLLARNTDSEEDIQTRIDKAEFEMTFSNKFDEVVVNDELTVAQCKVYNIVENFIQ